MPLKIKCLAVGANRKIRLSSMVKYLKILFIIAVFYEAGGFSKISADCEFNCQNIGNILVGPKGLKRIYSERINNPEFKNELKKSLKKSLKKMGKQSFYKTPKDCKSETVGGVVNGFVLSQTLKTSSRCLLFPKFDEKGEAGYNTKLVPFHIYADKFRLEDVDFEIEDPVCDGKKCISLVKIKHIKVSSSLSVGDISKGGGDLLEHPDFLFVADSKAHDHSASVEVIVTMDKEGRFDSAIGEFKSVKIENDSMSIVPVIRDFDGNILNNGIGSDGVYRESDDKENKHISKVSRQYRCDYFLKVFSESDEASAQQFYQTQSRELIRARKKQGLWNSKVDGKNIKKAFTKIMSKKREGKKITCGDKPQMFNYFPSFVEVSTLGELSAYGYSGVPAQQAFEGVTKTVNEGTFANDQVIRKFVIPRVEAEVLNGARDELDKAIRGLSDQARVLLDQDISLPVLDAGLDIRRSHLRDRILQLERRIKSVSGVASHSIPVLKRKIKESEKALADLDQEEADARDIWVHTRYSIGKINDLHRVRMINSNVQCSVIKGLDSGITSSKELAGHEFAFELPVSTIQAYLDQMYKDNPYICISSYKKDCKGGSKLKMLRVPKIECSSKGSCRLSFGKVESTTDSLIGDLNSGFDFEMDVDLKRCGESLCLNLDKPDVKNEGGLLWLKSVFSSSVQEDAKEAMDELRSTGGIDIGSVIPYEIRKSFKFGAPIIRENSVGIPMNLNKKGNRLIML